MSADKLRKQVEAAGWERVSILPPISTLDPTRRQVEGRDSSGDWSILVDGDPTGPLGYTATSEPGTKHETWYERVPTSTVPTPEQVVGRIEELVAKGRPV